MISFEAYERLVVVVYCFVFIYLFILLFPMNYFFFFCNKDILRLTFEDIDTADIRKLCD